MNIVDRLNVVIQRAQERVANRKHARLTVLRDAEEAVNLEANVAF